MEANLGDINHPDSNVLLPPRKRLLAGLKKQNSDGNSHLLSTFNASSEFDTRLTRLLGSHMSNSNLSAVEITEAARLAAAAAVKVTEAARAAAEEKAAIAAKAIAAAKDALELVATITEEAARRERCMKKNKMKKQVPVQMLYNKHQPIGNSKTDEELARKLHRAINSSPRISKNPNSDSKSYKHKRPKGMLVPENPKISNGVIEPEGNLHSKSNEIDTRDEVDSEGSTKEAYAIKLDEDVSKHSKSDQPKMDNRGAETSQLKEKILDSSGDTCSTGKKRCKIKQKSLPLSICTYKDQANLKDELKSGSSQFREINIEKPTANNKSFTIEPPSDGVILGEKTSLWKCQAFNTPVCVKQDKVVQS